MEISKDLLVSHFGCCLILGVSTCTIQISSKFYDTTEGGKPDFFLQKSFHSFGDGSSREAGHYVRVTDEGVTADARGRPWGPWGGTCPTPGQNNGDFIPWHALSAYSRDTAPRFWR